MRFDKSQEREILLRKAKLVVSCHGNKLRNLLPAKRLL